MNPRTQEQIAVMQASLEGKRIERKCIGGLGGSTEWVDDDGKGWNWACYDYRVAPESAEPRTWQCSVFSFGAGIHHLYEGKVSGANEEITVSEIPPGWKLVPPVAGLAPVAPDAIVDLMLAETFSSGVTLGASKVKQACDHIRTLHAANFATP